jgi:hypothetical protein
LLEVIDTFLRETGFADFEDNLPPEERIHPQRIVQAVKREAERAVREQIKSLSHYQDVKQLPRAKAGKHFSEIIEPFIKWRQNTRPRGLVKSGRATLTKQTERQILTTYRLFNTIMEDPVLTMVDRKMVQQFREKLELLPSSHGKTHGKVKTGPARTYNQELERKKESNL